MVLVIKIMFAQAIIETITTIALTTSIKIVAVIIFVIVITTKTVTTTVVNPTARLEKNTKQTCHNYFKERFN